MCGREGQRGEVGGHLPGRAGDLLCSVAWERRGQGRSVPTSACPTSGCQVRASHLFNARFERPGVVKLELVVSDSTDLQDR